jgi:hypothetical protein
MKKFILVFVVLAVALCFSAASVKAEIIKIGLTARVDSVGDPYNLLENKIQVGDIITGFYTYDSLTPNSSAWPLYEGAYQYTTAPYGMSLMVGGVTFQTDPANVDFLIDIANVNGEPDYCTVHSNNNLVVGDGLSVDQMHWQLDDYSGTAISSTELPLVPPDLSKWSNRLSIMGGLYPFPPGGGKTLFGINGHVTDVYLVPEPLSVCLLALGTLFLRRNCKK